MKNLLIILFISLGFSLSAQFNEDNYSLELIKIKYRANYRTAIQLTEGISNILSEDYNLVRRSNIQLSIIINTGKSNLIEGMDIQVVGKPEIKFSIKDNVTKNKNSYVYSKDLKVRTNKSLGEKLVNSFLNDDNAKKEFIAFVEEFVKKQFDSKCEKHFANIEKLANKKDYRNAIRQTMILIPSSCKAKAITLKDQLFKDQADYYCEKKIQKAKIMVNSGIFFQMKRAIKILLSIPPDAPCATEAFGLSKQIGEKMKELNKTSKNIDTYIQLFNENKDDWRSFYIKSIMYDNK